MLELRLRLEEQYDQIQEKFVYDTKSVLLEHSLYTISKWESIWKKPFLKKGYKMTPEEMLSYIVCMMQNGEDQIYLNKFSEEDILKIGEYIKDKQTATTVNSIQKTNGNAIVTSEVIYSKMVFAGVPFECQYWHLNRLLTLLEVIDAKANPKKMSKKETMDKYRELNRQRKQALKTKG